MTKEENNIMLQIIKQKYIGFTDQYCCWITMEEHEPFGWVRDEVDDSIRFITSVNKDGVVLNGTHGNCELTYQDACSRLSFMDGKKEPFGLLSPKIRREREKLDKLIYGF